MLIDALVRLAVGETLYTWSGRILDCEHSSVRADLVRLRLFRRREEDFLFRDIPPYRPAAVHRGTTQDESLHCMVFSSVPLFLIRGGSRKGRNARADDLHRNEDTVRIDLDASLRLDRPLEHADKSVERALELCAAMYDSFAAGGGIVRAAAESVYMPEFLLSSRKDAEHVYARKGREASAPVAESEGYTVRSGRDWYGQGVWCVDPGDLGHWYTHTGPEMVLKLPGHVVDVVLALPG